jgi:glycosyltransferase involved in cell wall biosynthesis
LIRETGAKNIELVGRQKDIFAWYARAAIFVLSSRREGFPNVLTEAMACRCAAVSFDCPYGPGEIIDDGRNGLLLRHRDERALASALVRLMDNPSLRRSLALEAARVQETYDAQRIAKQWEELFKRVAG